MPELDSILGSAPERIAGAPTLADLETVEAELVGRRSFINEQRRGLG
ncbi:MAG: hypothetical protein HKN80_05605, partial [Acidimicrobiia bacterium]|nr:hypothetical protein [Acidimicrobiia bacterium]